MTAAFAMIMFGGIALMAGVRNRPVVDILRGITSPLNDGGSQSGVVAAATTEIGRMKSGVVMFDGKPVCAWIAQELQKARDAGAQFSVNSGYRSAAEQARVCASTSNPCAAPGTSNHQGRSFPSCAVDVDGAASLAAHLPKGSPLKWTGPSINDDVHFSSGLSGV